MADLTVETAAITLRARDLFAEADLLENFAARLAGVLLAAWREANSKRAHLRDRQEVVLTHVIGMDALLALTNKGKTDDQP
jgi:hypothetical protein